MKEVGGLAEKSGWKLVRAGVCVCVVHMDWASAQVGFTAFASPRKGEVSEVTGVGDS